MHKNKINISNLVFFANEINALVLVFLLTVTVVIEFTLKELPCPLCLLQRAGFLMAGMGLLLNLRFGLRPSHYTITLLSILFTAFVALRQIALHIEPGTGAYGSSFLGYHLYTWSFIVAISMVLLISILLGFENQYHRSQPKSFMVKIILGFVLISMTTLVVSNSIIVLNICGLKECPENPTSKAIYYPEKTL